MKQFAIITSIILLITALFDIDAPYWYYQLLRWAVCIYALITAYKLKNRKTAKFIFFCVIAVLFNPIAPVYFDKDLWRIIDGLTGAVFLFFLFNKK